MRFPDALAVEHPSQEDKARINDERRKNNRRDPQPHHVVAIAFHRQSSGEESERNGADVPHENSRRRVVEHEKSTSSGRDNQRKYPEAGGAFRERNFEPILAARCSGCCCPERSTQHQSDQLSSRRQHSEDQF